MVKRKTTTTYEYDKDGNVIKKTITEEVFEENSLNTLTNPCTTPYYPSPFYYHNDPTCSTSTKASDIVTTKTNVIIEG